MAIVKHSFIALLLFTSVIASPCVTPIPLTSPFSSVSLDGRFSLQNNLWGEQSATDGSQNTRAIDVNGDSVSWETTYTWVGNSNQVKSYANLDLRVGIGKSLASISSIPTSWKWSYANESYLTADVSYDIWLSDVAGSWGATFESTFEIMIWLSARGGALPAGSQVAKTKIDGVSWVLYKGTVETWTVFSFVASKEIAKFTSDLLPFFTYLVSHQGVPSSSLLVQLQAGTEAFNGTATLTTSSYSAAIN